MLVEPSVVRGESGFECAVEERRTEGSRILTGVVRGERLVLDAAPFAASMAWEAGSVGTPALARVEGRMTLFYEGGVAGGIGRATRGPAGFERESSPVLVARETFEEGRVGAPAVGEGVLLYEAGRAATDAGNVCSRDAECGGALQRCRGGRCRAMPRVIGQVALAALGGPRTVALDPERVRSGDAGREDGTPLWGDLQGVGSPGVVGLTTREGEHITLLFFTGIGRERADVALNPSLGLALGVSSASAPATLRGYPYNPVLGESVLFTSPVGESGASPFLLDGASTPGSAASLRVVFERIEPNGAPGGLRIARPER